MENYKNNQIIIAIILLSIFSYLIYSSLSCGSPSVSGFENSPPLSASTPGQTCADNSDCVGMACLTPNGKNPSHNNIGVCGATASYIPAGIPCSDVSQCKNIGYCNPLIGVTASLRNPGRCNWSYANGGSPSVLR